MSRPLAVVFGLALLLAGGLAHGLYAERWQSSTDLEAAVATIAKVPRIEETGILVLKSGGHRRLPLEDARALSFTDRQPYAILINNKDSEGAKNFSPS